MIERVQTENIEEILQVINYSNFEAFKKIIPKKHHEEIVFTLEDLTEILRKAIFYVYKIEGRIVRTVGLEIEDKNTGKIRLVYILPEYQRKGIGAVLINHIEKIARDLGIRKLGLFTMESAKWAINFYRRLGYQVCDRKKNPWGFDVFMEKELKCL